MQNGERSVSFKGPPVIVDGHPPPSFPVTTFHFSRLPILEEPIFPFQLQSYSLLCVMSTARTLAVVSKRITPILRSRSLSSLRTLRTVRPYTVATTPNLRPPQQSSMLTCYRFKCTGSSLLTAAFYSRCSGFQNAGKHERGSWKEVLRGGCSPRKKNNKGNVLLKKYMEKISGQARSRTQSWYSTKRGRTSRITMDVKTFICLENSFSWWVRRGM